MTSLDEAARLNQLLQRIADLQETDPQCRAAVPIPSVSAAARQPGLRIAEVVQTVMEAYADRPALGERARELVADPATGRHTLQLRPRFHTVTYGELWNRVQAIAAAWHHDAEVPLVAGDFVGILGFGSIDFAATALACVHLGAPVVPLQTSAPADQHVDILGETEARVLAVGMDSVELAVEAVVAGARPKRLMVFDYSPEDDCQRERLERAAQQLDDAGCPVTVDLLQDFVARGESLPPVPPYAAPAGEDPLSALFYTSGSTGTPKGAMFTERLSVASWQTELPLPVISLSFMPMSHLMGYGFLMATLANGGTTYFAARSDLSTLLEDLSLVRPTFLSLVPRVCEMIYHQYLGEVDRRIAAGGDPQAVEESVKSELREDVIGGRVLTIGCGSAALAPEIHAFIESMMEMHLTIGYSSTEIAGGVVLVDGRVQRPPVVDYKLVDVPELGYFVTDRPHPRGELLVKSDRFMAGYYRRPELTAARLDDDGFYMTGDIMAEIGPDHLVYVDRRSNVLKLSQGEFVAVSRLEALYAQSPTIRQIYVYGNSERSHLLAVVVPTADLVAQLDVDGEATVKAAISRSLEEFAHANRLNSYEIPRDFLIETEPFSEANGLLTGVGKHQRPRLKERYGERLEGLYAQIARDQLDELRALRTGGTEGPVLRTVLRAARATLGISGADVRPDAGFVDLGGDSLAALSFSILLEDVFHVEVPVGVILDPTADLQQVADQVSASLAGGSRRPTFASVHGADSTKVHASDLSLDKFIDPQILASAPALPPAGPARRSVLLTGATGYLGRFLALQWLERLAETGGTLTCVVRGADADEARGRIESVLATDLALVERFAALAEGHLEVLAGDIGAPKLGLDDGTWQRLAATVDLIVHPAAHVNHRLPYKQLFGPNVVGTAELIRLALTATRKPISYVSTLGVNAVTDHLMDEDTDIRVDAPVCELDETYANGYGVSKWASEVLLREAGDRFDLPIAVFRPGMILAHSTYAGQLNVPDMLTRLLFSIAATGVAPATFYAADTSGGRPRARYDGFPVEFLAEAIAAIGGEVTDGFQTFNMSSSHENDVSLDSFVDWLIDSGCRIERIESYAEWVSRFETAMSALQPAKRSESVLALLDAYRQPQVAFTKSVLPVERFEAATRAAGYDIPNLTAGLIQKYISDLRQLQLLEPARSQARS